MPAQSITNNGIIAPVSDNNEIWYSPPGEFKEKAYFSSYNQYKKIYNFSIEDPEKFWSNAAKELAWFKQWKKVKQGKAFNSKWFVGGKANIAHNCLDVHLNTSRRNKAALIWEGEDGSTKIYTYQLLFSNVCSIANSLANLGIKKGDNIMICMGMVPEIIITILGCIRIGAVPSVVNVDMSSSTIKSRIKTLRCNTIFTQDFIIKKGSYFPLLEKIRFAARGKEKVENVIVFNRRAVDNNGSLTDGEINWLEFSDKDASECDALPVDAQHPVFSLFTNDPKGEPVKIQHLTGGYMVQAYLSSKWVFDLKDEDIIWTTSDISWASAHTYSLFGPLLNGATTFMYEGSPVYPHPDRYWRMISRYRINIFNTSPTLLKSFIKLGNEWIGKHDISSLRLLGTISEPIDIETWLWYYYNVGKEKIPIINTWMQTETGSIIISPFPGASDMLPGLICHPFPGAEIDIVDLNGNSVGEGDGGYLIIKDSWASMFSTEKLERRKIELNCWDQFKGNYFTGDAAIRKRNGFIKILGRVDDVIISGGNRVGGSEIERVLSNHPKISEAAVVKRPDEVIGSAIIAYVRLNEKESENLLLKEELRHYVTETIGEMAKPDELNFINKLPRLESGKINRRLLRKMSLEGTPELKDRDEEEFNTLERLREDYQKIYLR